MREVYTFVKGVREKINYLIDPLPDPFYDPLFPQEQIFIPEDHLSIVGYTFMEDSMSGQTLPDLTQLRSLSPLGGRYRSEVQLLEDYLSEFALQKYRAQVEIEYLILLMRKLNQTLPPIDVLRDLYRKFNDTDALAIAAWDRRVNHDVKAVEYWLRERIEALGAHHLLEYIHIGETSEDVTNVAYALMVRDAYEKVIKPVLLAIEAYLTHLAQTYAETVMPGRTHGQDASPTTFGKECNVFATRLRKARRVLESVEITGKFNGATGTFAAYQAALPEIDWVKFSEEFVSSFGLVPELITTQIESHDWMAHFFNALRQINTIILDLDQDFWRYISDGYLGQEVVTGEVGSSTMPHKINPINFENSEGNVGIANALLEFLSRKLPVSRLQRDLSDSTVLRCIGPAFGHSLLGYTRMFRALRKIFPNVELMRKAVDAHPELLAEAIQSRARALGMTGVYDALKAMTRGNTEVTLPEMHAFILSLRFPPEDEAYLLGLTPSTYIGLAPVLARFET